MTMLTLVGFNKVKNPCGFQSKVFDGRLNRVDAFMLFKTVPKIYGKGHS